MIDGDSAKRRIASSILLALLLLMPVVAFVSMGADADGSTDKDSIRLVSSVSTSSPIRVDNDAGLAALVAANGWSGSGSAADPYIIEGLRYIAPTADEVIRIANTTSHLVLRNIAIIMAANNAVVLSSLSNVTLDRCTITNGTYSIIIENSHDLAILGCTIGDNWYGIQLTSCWGTMIDNNSLPGNYMEAITLHSCSGVTISGNSLKEYNDGISLYSSTGNSIIWNTIDDFAYGVKLLYSDGNLVQRNMFRSPIYMEYSNGNDILLNELREGSYNSYIDLTGSASNQFRENVIDGGDFYLYSASNGNLFQGNRISNATEGLRIYNSGQNVLWGNEFRNACVELFANDEFENIFQIIPSNNTVNGRPIYYYSNANLNNATVPLDAGEVLADNVTYLTIQNLVLGDVAVGIEVQRSKRVTIQGNEVSNTAENNGIYLVRVNDSAVLNNNLISSNIWLSGSNNNSVWGNSIRDSIGLWLHSSIYNHVQGNTLLNASITLDSGQLLFSDPLEDLMFSENEIAVDNTVNGGPVYFIKYLDMAGGSVPADAGQIILAYVNNARVYDLVIGYQHSPLFVYHCSGTFVENNTFEGVYGTAVNMDNCDNGRFNYNEMQNCSSGLSLRGSNNIISHNAASIERTSGYEGEWLSVLGSNNLISYNVLSGRKWENSGVVGSHNRIEHNQIDGGSFGLGVGGDSNLESGNNVVRENVITNCSIDGIIVDRSNENVLIGNQISDCGVGIDVRALWSESDSTLANEFYGNAMSGCSLTISTYLTTLTSQVIPANNTVNGHPIYYYASVDLAGGSVPLDAGEVILADAHNISLSGLDLSDQSIGLQSAYSSHISVSECAFVNDSISGAQVYISESWSFDSNNFIDCTIGLDLKGSDNVVSRNTIFDSNTGMSISGTGDLVEQNLVERGGVTLEPFTSSIFRNNTIIDSTKDGLYLYSCTGSTITDNLISGSHLFGMSLGYCDGNAIERNLLIGNNGCGSTYDSKHAQAFDDRSNRWNSSLGNYWSDWTGPDANRDGIVDVAYAPSGNGIAFDTHPLASPVGVPYGLAATVDNGIVRVTWTGVNYSLDGPITGFTLYRSSTNGTISIPLGPGTRAYNDSAVAAPYNYTYWLVAAALHYHSGPSGQVSAISGQPPGPVIVAFDWWWLLILLIIIIIAVTIYYFDRRRRNKKQS